MNSRWPIDEATRLALVDSLVEVAIGIGENYFDRDTRVKAAKILVDMDGQNMEQEKREQLGTAADVKEHHHSGVVGLAHAEVDLETMTDIQLEHYYSTLRR